MIPDLITLSGGLYIADTGLIAFGGGAVDISGKYQVKVYREAGGTLDFVYYFTSAGPAAVERASMGQFDSFTTSASSMGAGVVPTNAVRAQANVVAFNFLLAGGGLVNAGQESTVVVRTNATNYAAGNFSLQNSLTTNLLGYQPTTVPEPVTLALVGAGLLAIGVSRRRA